MLKSVTEYNKYRRTPVVPITAANQFPMRHEENQYLN